MGLNILGSIAGLITMAILFLPMSLQAQLILGVSSLAGMLLFMTKPDSKPARLTVFAFAGVIALRYAYWRTTETLPPFNEPLNFIPAMLLYAAEMYTLGMLAFSLFVLSDPLKRKAAPMVEEDDLPTVDVFIPSYNEEPELLVATMAAAKGMNYPTEKLSIYLLDDGGTLARRLHKDPKVAIAAKKRHDKLLALCQSMGVHYHARDENSHAKAGNLNDGLRISKGELVVVFDADHAPVREFLSETVGYFAEDKKLFLVQTPHFFLNPDPIERNLKTFHKMPSENEMFYSITQRGLDKWNASFFCGSAAVLRRSCLELTDGFSGQSITEDCETALALHGKGFHSVYVDKPLIAGLQPETFVSFIGQRARWCQGMLQILILNRPFLAKGLTMAQRICYAGINLAWLFPLSRLTFTFSPLFYIFFNLEIYDANLSEFGSYAVVYLISSFALQSYLYGHVRWPWISELYEYVQSVLLIKSIASVVRHPRKPTFNVTAKGETLDKSGMSPISRPYVMIYILLAVANFYGMWRYLTEPGASDVLLIVLGWNLLNLALAGVALGVVSERRELRRNHRLSINRHALVRFDGKVFSAIVQDVSSGGVALYFLETAPVFSDTDETLPQVEIRRGGNAMQFEVVPRSVRMEEDSQLHGFAYKERDANVFVAIAELMYSEQSVLQDRLVTRQQRQNYLAGSYRFTLWALTEPLRAIKYMLKLAREAKVESKPDAKMQIVASNQDGASHVVEHDVPLHDADPLKYGGR